MRDRKGVKVEGRGGTGRKKERGNYNQDLLYEKTIHFQIKENLKKKEI